MNILNFKSELDTLSATLKQLENQRGEAQKRLDDLKAQVGVFFFISYTISKDVHISTVLDTSSY